MDAQAPRGALRFFANMKDPRSNQGKRHRLLDMIVIAITAVICNADGWEDVELFGGCKEKWFRTFLDLPHGIPSHDTFGRVFARLDPHAFEACFREWMAHLGRTSKGRLIAVDGKTLRRSFDTAAGKAALHMINAWCVTNQTVLGQVVCDEKANEITTMPKLLELLDLQGAVVTADAMHCQKATARKIGVVQDEVFSGNSVDRRGVLAVWPRGRWEAADEAGQVSCGRSVRGPAGPASEEGSGR